MNKINNEDFNLIEDYISKELTPKQEEEFKEQLKKDDSFAKNYEFRIMISKLWNDSEKHKQTKRMVKSLGFKLSQQKKQWRLIALALSSIACIVIFILFLNKHKEPNVGLVSAKINADTAQDLIIMSDKKQPKLGSLHKFTPIYFQEDTLVIPYEKEYPSSCTISIMHMPDSTLKATYFMKKDSNLHIDLDKYYEGTYCWNIEETEFTGTFIVKNNSE